MNIIYVMENGDTAIVNAKSAKIEISNKVGINVSTDETGKIFTIEEVKEWND